MSTFCHCLTETKLGRILNVLPDGDTLGLSTGSVAYPCNCQVTAMVDGRKPDVVHRATVETDVLSVSVLDGVSTGMKGRTGKNIKFKRIDCE